MVAAALTRIERILDLEERQGWRNRGVIGGLQAMAERWAGDARGEGVDERQIEALVELMRAYGVAEQVDRPEIARAIRRAADPDFVATLEIEDLAELIEVSDDLTPLTIPEGEATPVVVSDDLVAPASAPLPPAPGLGAAYVAAGDDLADFDDFDELVIPPPEPTHKAKERIARQQQKSQRNPADLDARVTVLSGVGESTAEQLARLGIVKVIDLLWRQSRHRAGNSWRLDRHAACRLVEQVDRQTTKAWFDAAFQR
ncbi:MAG: hypothetical protein ACK4SA_05370 [Caldilinea sp.]